ncbi:hypothetical protein [Paenibacillus xylanexedens]|uniref:hypothetical protein n=1 Tax=Paenibacillus xylanexedens TaxID=528191 RepID=UPI000F53D634|nr:hypothetical protein [Paenibacillus xylanexedens]
MKKRLTGLLMAMMLVFLLIPTGLASASTVDESRVPSIDYQSPIISVNESGQVPAVTAAPGNDNVEIQATSPFTVDISDPRFGAVTGSWNYSNPGKMVSFINLNMELQYRTSFLDFTWETIDSHPFVYSGGLGSQAGDEKTFRISEKGQYRIKVTGTVTYLGGTSGSGTHIAHLLTSAQKGYDGGGVIISDEPEVK